MATTRFAPSQKPAGSPRPKGRGTCLSTTNIGGKAINFEGRGAKGEQQS